MKFNIEITDTLRLKAKLAEFARGKTKSDVEVGYMAPYATYVHEDLMATHKDGKQAKYLEGPARRLDRELARIVTETFRSTRDLDKANLAAAQRLLTESQAIVPVDTGALKASGYAALKKDADAAAAAGLARYNAIAESKGRKAVQPVQAKPVKARKFK